MQRGWVVSPDYRRIIDLVRDARLELGLSQREVARRLGKHPSFVNKIEKLERRLDILEFMALAEAIEADPADLIKRIRANLSERLEV